MKTFKEYFMLESKKIKYLTLNGFEVKMTHDGFEKFEKDNKETIKHWSNLLDSNKKPYYRTKSFSEFVVVYCGKDFETKPLLSYIEKNYEMIADDIKI